MATLAEIPCKTTSTRNPTSGGSGGDNAIYPIGIFQKVQLLSKIPDANPATHFSGPNEQ